MGQLLELLGASIIGGFIMLIALTLNMQISDSAREIFQSTYNQRSAITASQVIEYDFYKAGYGVTSEKVIHADSNAVKFRSDLDNNGTIDTIYYYTGATSAMTSTTNPNDKQLYRKVSSQSANLVSIITRFNIVYYDSIGNQLNYSTLSSSVQRSKIRGMRAYVKTELPDAINNLYNPMEWREMIRSKNL
jgi:hypothetical protein